MRSHIAFAFGFVFGCHSPASHDVPDALSRPPDATADGTVDTTSPETQIPIKHVIIVVKENHTFDNYFGSFPGADGISQITTNHGVIAPPHAQQSTSRDLCHDHPCALVDWANGANNGWDLVDGASVGGDDLVYAQYQESDIPNYWQYARHYTLADRFFANVLGPSFPGHTFVLAAQDAWATSNPDSTGISAYWGCDQASDARLP